MALVSPALSLQDRVVIVTGAAQGLGAVTAQTCAGLGAAVVIADVNDDRTVADGILDGGGTAIALHLDVTEAQSWTTAVARTIEQFGRIDGLVNNAGITHRVPLQRVTPDEWQRVMDVNLAGTFLGIQTVGAAMDARRGGSIVNISSSLGLIGHAATAYTTSKWAVRGLTRSAAGLLAEHGVRVNSVHPGIMRTPMAHSGSSEYLDANVALTPLGRIAEAQEIANVVAFLLSDLSSYVTGAEIAVDGGLAAYGGQLEAGRLMSAVEESQLGRQNTAGEKN